MRIKTIRTIVSGKTTPKATFAEELRLPVPVPESVLLVDCEDEDNVGTDIEAEGMLVLVLGAVVDAAGAGLVIKMVLGL